MGMMSRKVMAGASGVAADITSFSHPNLIAAYTMDNVSGTTLFDESPNNRDMTLVNGPSFVAGVVGNAISYVPNQYATRSSSGFLTSQGSIVGWANGDTFNRLGGVHQPGINNYFQFFFDGTGKLVASFRTGAIGYTEIKSDTAAATPSALSMYAVVCDGSSLQMYIDGSPVTHSVTSGTESNMFNWFSGTTATAFEIGRSADSSIFYSTGKSDQMRLFDIPLTASNITGLNNGGSGI